MTHLSKSGMLPLLLNVISTPIANQGCLSVPVFKGPSAALTGVACCKSGFLFWDSTAAAPCKYHDWASHLCEQRHSLAQWDLSYWTGCARCSAAVWFIHPEFILSPGAPDNPLQLRGLSAVLCLSAEHTWRQDSIISSQHKQGTEAQGSLPEVAQAVDEEGIKPVFLRLDLGQ